MLSESFRCLRRGLRTDVALSVRWCCSELAGSGAGEVDMLAHSRDVADEEGGGWARCACGGK